MRKCIQCGTELSETSLFCKKCGTPVENEINQKNKEICLDDFQALSLEMRKISDKMIAVYVFEMKKLEREHENIIETTQKELSSLREKLIVREKELIGVKERLATTEDELKNKKIELSSMESDLKFCKEKLDNLSKVNSEQKEESICPGCGELITNEMIFCGCCGICLK